MLVETSSGGFGHDLLVRAPKVAVRLADPAARERLADAIAASPDFLVRADATVPADLVVADRDSLADGAGVAPVVLLGAADRPPGRRSPVRAHLPVEADAVLILAALRIVAAGLVVMPEPARAGWGDDGDDEPAPARLTPREGEVLRLLADGASNKIIARRLEISVHTAKFHVASVLQKLGASGRLEAVGIGLRTGLLML